MKPKAALFFILAGAMLLPGCRKPLPRPDAPHPRLVSFSPAITQMLFDIGLGEHVVGVTSQCILPPGQHRTVVGDALQVDDEAILAAKPDVLLVQMKTDEFRSLRRVDPKIRIEHFTIESLKDIEAAIERLGQIVGNPDALRLAAEAKTRFADRLDAIRRRASGKPRPRVLFAEGYENPLVPGAGTFIDEMITLAGGLNAARTDKPHPPWRSMDIEGIILGAPEVLICRVKAAQRQAARNYWLAVPNLPAAGSGNIFIVTDRRWTIPSGHSVIIAEKLARMIHPNDGGQGR